MNRSLCAASALVCLLALGCDKKEPPPVAAPEAATPAAPAAAPAPVAEPVVDVASLPVEEQYEAAAEKELTSANLEAKLDEIEKELAAP